MTTLTRTWLLLIALTIVSLLAGRAEDADMLGALGRGLILLAALFKAHQILRHYLDLSHASAGWRVLFSVSLIGLCGTLMAIYAIAPA